MVNPRFSNEPPAAPGPTADPGRDRRRLVLFAVLAAACSAAVVAYVIVGRSRSAGRSHVGPLAVDAAQLAAVRQAPHVIFRDAEEGGARGQIMVAPLGEASGARSATPLTCERVHFATNTGLCLAAEPGLLRRYSAYIFDASFRRMHSIRLPGIPSRARVSPDGRLAAYTVFVSGDSYATAGFSTRTELLETRTGRSLGNLEEFAVSRDGTPFKSIDFNFWGVTFAAGGNRFYATLSTAGQTYLVEGDVSARSARVLASNVECPSLSPDGTRLVFKKRVKNLGRVLWRLAVIELGTRAEHLVASETRTVDDQAEWFDSDHVAYALPDQAVPGRSNVWVTSTDGTGEPRILLRGATSPAVIHSSPQF